MGMVDETLFGSSFCEFDKKDFEIECEDKYDKKCDEKWEEKLNENCKNEDLIIEDSVWSTEKGRKTTNLDFGVNIRLVVLWTTNFLIEKIDNFMFFDAVAVVD